MNNSSCQEHNAPGGPLLLQVLWNDLRSQQEFLSSPYKPGLFAFLIHLILCTPFLALEVLGHFLPGINIYRISRTSETLQLCLQRWLDCFARIAIKYLTTVLPGTALYQFIRMPSFPVLAPSYRQLIGEVIACLLVFDALFFVLHYAMHRVPWLYRRVHQPHHQNRITFALAAQDASAAELLSLQMLAMISAWVVGCHPMSEVVFHLLNTWLAIEDHCGYNFPWALHRLLPCFGGAPFHQAHHHVYRGNFAPYFKHWDWLCGTYLHAREEAGRKHGGRTMRRRRRKKSLGSDCVCVSDCVC
ncbi:cholesterol 25-hydroxylase-like protein [Esox lucius]|uniref:Fatty acid hydroxylase domain-containing protein n=1 Tax=Esox lucius TaxID=8010 RepID=A0A3P8ZJS8_ESOLU|nr:cholesterol 25-hydroxylase-like protein [Esox lucius]